MQLNPYEWLADIWQLPWIVAAVLGIHGQDKLCEMILTQCMFLCSYNTRLTGHPYGQANIKSDKYQQPCIREGYCHAPGIIAGRLRTISVPAGSSPEQHSQPITISQDDRAMACAQDRALARGSAWGLFLCLGPVLVTGHVQCGHCRIQPPAGLNSSTLPPEARAHAHEIKSQDSAKALTRTPGLSLSQ